ncbi:MAG: histidine--tRNA ligase [Verrucomicrobiota bacterium JB023]|nr:histidine--tRNA ligase [Verrucomicrobiota bacterium JB023]
MASGFQTLPGFRDFDPRTCMLRNYLFETWREVARKYGFSEYETPILEPTELYLKKSGGELATQLFRFEDQGGRDVTLRPEVTASLARLAAAEQRNYPKPLKWFEIGQCFRYEKPQKGRTREFYQFNTDLLGDDSPAADAELIALSIDTMRALGFSQDHFKVRLSDRSYLTSRLQDLTSGAHSSLWSNPESLVSILSIIDRFGKDSDKISEMKLGEFGLSLSDILNVFDEAKELIGNERLGRVYEDLTARGLGDFVEIDLSIVRGLAYYTGVVFEIFDTSRSLRAVAGGGRYNTLVSTLTDGKTELPAIGFAMGDVVIGHFIKENTAAKLQFEHWQREQSTCDFYLVIDDEEKRPEALKLAQDLRNSGLRIDFPLTKTKFDKQLKAATATMAPYALIIGRDYPELKLRHLSSRHNETIRANAPLADLLRERLDNPEGGLLA